MNELYSFYISKEKEIEKTEETPDGKLTKKVKESIPVKLILKKPSRLEMERAEEVYAVEWSESVKKGILTKPMLARVYSDSGGFFSKEESGVYIALLESFGQKDLEYKKIGLVSNPDEDTEKRKKNLQDELSSIVVKIQNFENQQSQIFDQTAEVRARNKTIQWLVLNLTYTLEDSEDPKPFFKGKNDDEKQESYYLMLEGGDDFDIKVVDKSALTFSFWYMGKASSKEDFEFLDKQIESESKEES